MREDRGKIGGKGESRGEWLIRIQYIGSIGLYNSAARALDALWACVISPTTIYPLLTWGHDNKHQLCNQGIVPTPTHTLIVAQTRDTKESFFFCIPAQTTCIDTEEEDWKRDHVRYQSYSKPSLVPRPYFFLLLSLFINIIIIEEGLQSTWGSKERNGRTVKKK